MVSSKFHIWNDDLLETVPPKAVNPYTILHWQQYYGFKHDIPHNILPHQKHQSSDRLFSTNINIKAYQTDNTQKINSLNLPRDIQCQKYQTNMKKIGQVKSKNQVSEYHQGFWPRQGER